MTTNETKASHTPGPLVVELGSTKYAGQPDRINRILIATPKNERGGRHVTATIEGPFCGDMDRHLADAKLYAAAPDLLAAAKRAISALAANGAPNCEAAKELMAAITKAQGA